MSDKTETHVHDPEYLGDGYWRCRSCGLALAVVPARDTDFDGDLPNDVPLTREGHVRQAAHTEESGG